MTIDDILLYIGIASGLGIIGMLLPGYVRKLLNDSKPGQPKSVTRF